MSAILSPTANSCRSAQFKLKLVGAVHLQRHAASRKHHRAPRALRCVADTGEESSSIDSYKERLKRNPAYQRLKQSTWQQAYKPSENHKNPGPIPEHLLGDNNVPQSRKLGGSITQHMDKAERPQASGQDQPHASTSGRSPDNADSSQRDPSSSGSQSLQLSASNSPAARVLSPPSSSRVSRVRFWLQFHAQFGQRVRIVGSHEVLGKWLVSQGGELEWSSGDKWNAILEIPAGAIVEYKYVLLEGDGVTAIAWQQGNNNVLAVGHADDNVEVFDTWESGPGAAVMAAGEKSTREGRMLAWATEVETLFASQRNDLRKSRMELLAAQDEARLAREEARQFQAELRSSRAELTKAELRVRELAVSNRMLKTQLTDTNQSFRHALETTHKFLLEAENALTGQTQNPDSVDQGSDKSTDGEHSRQPSAATAKRKSAPVKRASPRKTRKGKKALEEEAAAAEALSNADGSDDGIASEAPSTDIPEVSESPPEEQPAVTGNGAKAVPQEEQAQT